MDTNALWLRVRNAEVPDRLNNNAGQKIRPKNKVRVGIEPTNKSFADSRLTTWPPHHHKTTICYTYYSKKTGEHKITP